MQKLESDRARIIDGLIVPDTNVEDSDLVQADFFGSQRVDLPPFFGPQEGQEIVDRMNSPRARVVKNSKSARFCPQARSRLQQEVP